jgi:osmotically-inducible protein OsmY
VTEIVDDLLSPSASSAPIQDATVVEGSAEEVVEPPTDDELARRVREVLAAEPGLLPGNVEVDVVRARVVLRGQVERAATITDLERRAGAVAGIRGVDSRLHLPGTPPPTSSSGR